MSKKNSRIAVLVGVGIFGLIMSFYFSSQGMEGIYTLVLLVLAFIAYLFYFKNKKPTDTNDPWKAVDFIADQTAKMKNSFNDSGTSSDGIRYKLSFNGQSTDFYSWNELKQMAAKGQLNKNTYAWKEGMEKWEKAGAIGELAGLFAPAPPPPPPAAPPPPPPVPAM